jgi:hypothetical protein
MLLPLPKGLTFVEMSALRREKNKSIYIISYKNLLYSLFQFVENRLKNEKYQVT